MDAWEADRGYGHGRRTPEYIVSAKHEQDEQGGNLSTTPFFEALALARVEALPILVVIGCYHSAL